MMVKCPKCGETKRTYSNTFRCCGVSFKSSDNDAFPPKTQTPKLQNQGEEVEVSKRQVEKREVESPTSKITKEEVSVKHEPSLSTITGSVTTSIESNFHGEQKSGSKESNELEVQKDKLEIIIEEEAVQKANLDDWKYQCKSCGALFNKFDDESDPHCPNPKCNEALSLP